MTLLLDFINEGGQLNMESNLYLDNEGIDLEMDGDKVFAHRTNFTNLQERDGGFGDTIQEALSDLSLQGGYTLADYNIYLH